MVLVPKSPRTELDNNEDTTEEEESKLIHREECNVFVDRNPENPHWMCQRSTVALKDDELEHMWKVISSPLLREQHLVKQHGIKTSIVSAPDQGGKKGTAVTAVGTLEEMIDELSSIVHSIDQCHWKEQAMNDLKVQLSGKSYQFSNKGIIACIRFDKDGKFVMDCTGFESLSDCEKDSVAIDQFGGSMQPNAQQFGWMVHLTLNRIDSENGWKCDVNALPHKDSEEGVGLFEMDLLECGPTHCKMKWAESLPLSGTKRPRSDTSHLHTWMLWQFNWERMMLKCMEIGISFSVLWKDPMFRVGLIKATWQIENDLIGKCTTDYLAFVHVESVGEKMERCVCEKLWNLMESWLTIPEDIWDKELAELRRFLDVHGRIPTVEELANMGETLQRQEIIKECECKICHNGYGYTMFDREGINALRRNPNEARSHDAMQK